MVIIVSTLLAFCYCYNFGREKVDLGSQFQRFQFVRAYFILLTAKSTKPFISQARTKEVRGRDQNPTIPF